TAVQARRGAGDAAAPGRLGDVPDTDRVRTREVPESDRSGTRVGPESDPSWTRSAPAAATAFSATPTHVAPVSPIAGISQNPAATAPTAAPAVFAAYRTPTSAAAVENHDAAIGNVAPIAAAGTPRIRRLTATRTTASRAGAVPSAYAHASSGVVERSAKGSSSALTATPTSSAA